MHKSNPLLSILKNLKFPKLLLLSALIISSIGSIAGLLVPWFTGELVNKINGNSLSFNFLVIVISIFLLNAIISGVGLYLLSKIGEKIIFSIRCLVWNHIVRLKTSFFDSNESGELLSRIIDDTKVINTFVSHKIPSPLPNILTIIGSIIMLFILDWKMTLCTFVIVPLFFMIILPLGQMMEKTSNKTQNEIAQFSGMISRILSEIRLVKVSSTENLEVKNGKDRLTNIYNLGIKQAKITSIIEPISSILVLLMIAIVLGFGGWRVSSGNISSGNLVAMIFYVFQLVLPISNISTLITDYKQAKGASFRLSEILSQKTEEIEGKRNEDLDIPFIKFENVTFSYDKEEILKNLSFTIPQNKVTAFVGPSGSGKSTIFNLIEKMYDIDNGKIYIGNSLLSDLDLLSWRKNLGYVMQDNSMMSGTIRDNILYGLEDQEIKDDYLDYYCKLANCYDFVNNLEERYDTFIGERGVKLSGGQRQRIDIARSFIKNPKVLLLDEITANLDSESEHKIQDAMSTLMKDRTTIIIAHRLSTIQKADQIIFLDNGVITGMGDHNSLYNSHKKYKEFVLNQHI
ncbi:ATP-binding cassette transporter A [Staphylococcus aureus]|uniref:ABC transporter ATP-binding protein n=1 Tax=Staphylococcus aureus TaxID=1280 RepID=UPI00085C5B75|nr:ABC transporter ATP-binding protein [Staphylococcus aureus]SCT29818.1 ATP-binding cassette transporter A [Staphylococcus aureus]